MPGRGVLVTRPRPGADRTAEALRGAGWVPVLAPMLRIISRPASLPSAAAIQAVLVTSGNALAALPATLHRRPLLAVGARTAERAREAGFGEVSSADGDALALARLVAERLVPRDGPVLLATAQGQGGMLTELLRAQGFGVLRRAVYAARPERRLPTPARDALAAGELAAALFFSAETARAFAAALTGADCVALARVTAISISPTVDAALGALPFARRRVASHPDADAVLAELQQESLSGNPLG